MADKAEVDKAGEVVEGLIREWVESTPLEYDNPSLRYGFLTGAIWAFEVISGSTSAVREYLETSAHECHS